MNNIKYTNQSFSEIADKNFVSSQTVRNIFNKRVDFKAGVPSSYMCIDEKCYVHGNTKYALIILDFESNKVIDVCKDRKKTTLMNWLRHARDYHVIPNPSLYKDTSSASSKENKRTINLKMVCIDMNQHYLDAINAIFPGLPVAVDSFHVMQNVMSAFNNVRLSVMNSFLNTEFKQNKKMIDFLDDEQIDISQPIEYRIIKKYWKLLSVCGPVTRIKPELKKYNRMIDQYADQQDVLDYVLNIDKRLSKTWSLKQQYAYFNSHATKENASELLKTIIIDFNESQLRQFVKLSQTLSRWHDQIINSFTIVNDNRRISNGPIEGANSKIQKLIVNSNGIPSFETLRKRILYSHGTIAGIPLNKRKK
ncbi:MAG: transposase [Erysipelotrichaceae bacterium]